MTYFTLPTSTLYFRLDPHNTPLFPQYPEYYFDVNTVQWTPMPEPHPRYARLPRVDIQWQSLNLVIFLLEPEQLAKGLFLQKREVMPLEDQQKGFPITMPISIKSYLFQSQLFLKIHILCFQSLGNIAQAVW